MKKIFFFVFLISIGVNTSFSQSNSLDKKLEKAYKFIEKEKYEEAEKYLVKLLNANSDFGKGWDLLGDVREQLYIDARKKDKNFGNFQITVKDEAGNVKENDSLANKLAEMMNSFRPSKTAYNKYIYTLRKGTLLSNSAYKSSLLLRSYFIDKEIDTNVCNKAMNYFDDAEEEFSNKNFFQAAKLYKKAIDLQPDFYKANLYLGDSYFYLENYIEAAKIFNEAVEKFPNLVEPRKYLIDTYIELKDFENALKETISAMCVYPDVILALKLENLVYYNDKTYNIKWIQRKVFPNKISNSNEINDYIDPDMPEPDNIWLPYVNAKEKIKDFCNDKGIIIASTDLTKSKYLEVYSWEEMLKNCNDESLNEARKMQSLGYLDCYVLVTCFHYDIYDQYENFVKNNKEKVIEYFNKFIN